MRMGMRQQNKSPPRFKTVLLHQILSFLFGFAVCRLLLTISLEITPEEINSPSITVKSFKTGAIGRQENPSYEPAPVEKYIVENVDALGYHENPASGCNLWKNDTLPFYRQLQQILLDFDEYYQLIDNYTQVVQDVRRSTDTLTCDKLELHPRGLRSIFKSEQLSKGDIGGYVEPLLPPMRHPRWCLHPRRRNAYLLKTTYLVHDFAYMCRNSIQPSSRTVFMDMGAALNFDFHKDNTPVIDLIRMYEKFGFKFDHIYAYEMKFTEPKKVFQLVPDNLLSSYHWINVGVEVDQASKQNPWKLLLENYDENDFVVVKLDIDHSTTEIALIDQLLANPDLLKLVDQFYFEHHVGLKEWVAYSESAKKSLLLFDRLRKSGIPAHYWI